MKKFCSFALVILSVLSLSFADSKNEMAAKISKQAHSQQIVKIVQDVNNPSMYYTAGKDGFVTKWNAEGIGAHFQVTTDEIKGLAVCPGKNEIAIYETSSGFSNTITVWDWDKLEKKYSYTFNDNILTFGYSKKGTYLILGTTSEDGLLFIKASDGKLTKVLNEKVNMVSFFETTATEKTIMMYSLTGKLTYASLDKGDIKKKITVEKSLSDITTFNSNMNLAAKQGSEIKFIDAMTGKTLRSVEGASPIITKYNDDVYYYDNNNIYTVTATDTSVSKPAVVKAVALKNVLLSDLCFTQDEIVFASKRGQIYTCKNTEDKTVTPAEITDIHHKDILDTAIIENDAYFLTKDSILKLNLEDNTIEKVIANSAYFTKITPYNNNLLLWSQIQSSKVQLLDLSTKKPRVLFTTEGAVSNIKVCGNDIIEIEGNSKVHKYDEKTKKLKEIYYGSGILDAVLIKGTNLYIAKSVAGKNDSALLFVNTKTRETLPLPVNISVLHSIGYTSYVVTTDEGDEEFFTIYAAGLLSEEKKETSKIIIYNVDEKKEEVIYSTDGSYLNSFMTIINDNIYNNIGVKGFNVLNLKNKKTAEYARDYVITNKVLLHGENVYTLNSDGGVTKYNGKQTKESNLYISAKNELIVE